jgi:transcriptional regulator with GAF, ATPase, and Fis domain
MIQHDEHSPQALVTAFSELAAHVYASEDAEQSMCRITQVASSAITGCAAASLSLLMKGGPQTFAATHPLAHQGDQIQYAEGEGPCLDAAMEQRWVYSPRVAEDARWPRSGARLGRELGVGSMMSCRLTLDAAAHQTLGGLNLYATAEDAFDAEDQMLAVLLSSIAAVVVDSSRQQAGLRAAVQSRQVIGEAIGMLRAHDPELSREDAFGLLSAASQRTNLKLRDLAQRIADREPLKQI